MSVWVVGKRGEGLALGADVRVTYPSKHARDVIYYQGRPVPTFSATGSRHFGVLSRIEEFDSVGLIVCEITVLGQMPQSYGGRLVREYHRPQ